MGRGVATAAAVAHWTGLKFESSKVIRRILSATVKMRLNTVFRCFPLKRKEEEKKKR